MNKKNVDESIGSVYSMAVSVYTSLNPNSRRIIRTENMSTNITPRMMELITMIPQDYLPSQCVFLWNKEAATNVTLDTKKKKKRLFRLLHLIPVHPKNHPNYINAHSTIVDWVDKTITDPQKVSEIQYVFFNGKSIQLVLLVTVLPMEIIQDDNKLGDILSIWCQQYDTIFTNQQEFIDLMTTFRAIATHIKTNDSIKNLVRKSVGRILDAVARFELEDRYRIIYTALRVPSYVNETFKHGLTILAIQPGELRGEVLRMLPPRLFSLSTVEFDVITKTMRRDISMVIMALNKLPSSMPELGFQQEFIDGIYFDEAHRNDPIIMKSIAHQAMVFSSKNVFKIWKIMGWRMDRDIRENMIAFHKERRWAMTARDVADIIMYTLKVKA
ncbi:MAG: hypothetical protein ACTSUE_27030 [Promethearchaeota archaeon]